MASPTGLSTLDISDSCKVAPVFSWSDILETGDHLQKYCLTGLHAVTTLREAHHEAGRVPTITLRNAGNGNARGVVVVGGTVQSDGADGPFPSRAWEIRACTPGEEEARQGFPKGYTGIAWDGKPATECPDQPRYEAIGNSMAVPVMRCSGKESKPASMRNDKETR